MSLLVDTPTNCVAVHGMHTSLFHWSVQINQAQEAIQEGTEGAKDAVQDVADKVGDAVKKVTGQD